MFNATLSNISAISWRPVLVVEETGVLGRWFSMGTLASSTTNAGHHDIAEILLKVALNTKKSQNKSQICSGIVRDTYYTQSFTVLILVRIKESFIMIFCFQNVARILAFQHYHLVLCVL
jgi:hypothetical protein